MLSIISFDVFMCWGSTFEKSMLLNQELRSLVEFNANFYVSSNPFCRFVFALAN